MPSSSNKMLGTPKNYLRCCEFETIYSQPECEIYDETCHFELGELRFGLRNGWEMLGMLLYRI